MVNKVIFGFIWLLFSMYAFFIAPSNDANTLDLIINLSSFIGIFNVVIIDL